VTSLGTRGPGGILGQDYVQGMYMKQATPYKEPVSGNPLPEWTIQGGDTLLDTDQDGMPDDWETALGFDARVADQNEPGTGGYTRLENYLHWMAEPHARLRAGGTLELDLARLGAGFIRHSPQYAVFNAMGGTVTLLPDGHTARYIPRPAFAGPGSFQFTVTAADGSAMTRTVGILVPPAARQGRASGSARSLPLQ